MKSLIFVLCLCVATTAVAGSWIDDASKRIARLYHLPTADVKACYLEANINLLDGLVTALILTNEDTSDVQKSALKVGCLFACVFKKKEWMDGTTFNVEKLKNDTRHLHSNPERQNQILDTCIDQVKNLINECEVMLNYIKCMAAGLTHSLRKEFNKI